MDGIEKSVIWHFCIKLLATYTSFGRAKTLLNKAMASCFGVLNAKQIIYLFLTKYILLKQILSSDFFCKPL